MRVLMISKACLVGTYQRKLEEIAAFNDIDLTVITPPSWRDSRGTIKLERTHTTGYALLVDPIALNGSFHLHFYPRLSQRIAEVQPDVVHIDEEPYNLATWHALWLAKRAGAQALFFTWQNILRRYPFPFNRGERWVLENADYGIAGTQDAADIWRAKGYIGPMAVIPQFGVDTTFFSPAGKQTPGTPFTIGYAGRLVPEKGVDLLLEAAAGLPGNWRLEIVGSGPAYSKLNDQATQLGFAERVRFTDWMPSHQMPDFYREIDALVVPSRAQPNWKEQFGRVIIEAMACGTPVIGARSGAIPEVVGDAGLTFPEGDFSALQKTLSRLMRDTGLWARLAREGRARVWAKFTQKRIALETVHVYRLMQQRAFSHKHNASAP